MTKRCAECGSFMKGDTFGTCSDCGEPLTAESHTEEGDRDLTEFGMSDENAARSERESQIDHGIESFGADTRDVGEPDSGEQAQLVPDVDNDQSTLTGENAAKETLFGGDDQ